MLTVGFSPEELGDLRALLTELEAHMVELIVATDRMLDMPLSQAYRTGEGQSDKGKAGRPIIYADGSGSLRTLVLYGMHASEVMEITSAYSAAQPSLPPAVFAAAVPRNAHRKLRSLLVEWARDYVGALERRQRP